MTSSRSFDLNISTKSGPEYTFTSINKEEYEALETYLKEKKIRVKNQMNDADLAIAALEDDDDDDEVCAICLKPDSEPPNEIIFCENCDMAVHQECYNIPVIPEGDWICRGAGLSQSQVCIRSVWFGRKYADRCRSRRCRVQGDWVMSTARRAVHVYDGWSNDKVLIPH